MNDPNQKSVIEKRAVLDVLRWVSACAVAIGHLRSLLFVDYTELVAPSSTLKLFYFVTGFGHEAVIVFFVISGYLVGGKLLLEQIKLDALIEYLIHRFARIYIVLLPALALTLTLDILGSHLSNSFALYKQGGWSAALNYVIEERLGVQVLLCNAFNLQEALCPAFGSNAPLWSLAYEWFYYLTFPAILMVLASLRAGGPTILADALWIICLIALFFVFWVYVPYYSIWIMGAVARYAGFYFKHRNVLAYGGLMTLAILLAGTRLYTEFGLAFDFAIGFVLALILASGDRIPVAFSRFHTWLASFSYSLYVIHFPFLVFSTAILLSLRVIEGRQDPNIVSMALFILIAAIMYVSAWGFSLVTEHQTAALRQWIRDMASHWSDRPRHST